MDSKTLLNNIPTGDNGKLVDTDWKLKDFGEVLTILQKMPTLDKQIYHYSQYADINHLTACAMYSSIDAIASIANKDFTKQEIDEVIAMGEKAGWIAGSGWARGNGVNVVKNRWNTKYPDNKIISFLVEYGTPEFNLVMSRLGTSVCSISVDGVYWKDARDNLKIDGEVFNQLTGHATSVMNTGEYICVDSVPQSVWKEEIKLPMVYTWGDKFDKLVKKGNIRTDFHIFVMESWLKQTLTQTERERLENFKIQLNKAIAANSAIRNLTTQENERVERKKMNDYNRAKLTVIEAMLK